MHLSLCHGTGLVPGFSLEWSVTERRGAPPARAFLAPAGFERGVPQTQPGRRSVATRRPAHGTRPPGSARTQPAAGLREFPEIPAVCAETLPEVAVGAAFKDHPQAVPAGGSETQANSRRAWRVTASGRFSGLRARRAVAPATSSATRVRSWRLVAGEYAPAHPEPPSQEVVRSALMWR